MDITFVTLYSVIPILDQQRNQTALSLIRFEIELVNVCQMEHCLVMHKAGLRPPEIGP